MDSHSPNRVIITDIKMPFWSMVVFMVKAAIASIPAVIILVVLSAVLTALVGRGLDFLATLV